MTHEKPTRYEKARIIWTRPLWGGDWKMYRDMRIQMTEAMIGGTQEAWMLAMTPEEYFRDILDNEYLTHYMVDVDHTPSALCSVAQVFPGCYTLYDLYVSKDVRRHGLAERLVHSVLERIESTDPDATSVDLEVLEGNSASRALCEKVGFVYDSTSGDRMRYVKELRADPTLSKSK